MCAGFRSGLVHSISRWPDVNAKAAYDRISAANLFYMTPRCKRHVLVRHYPCVVNTRDFPPLLNAITS